MDGHARYVSRYPNLRLTMEKGGSQPMINTRTGIQELHVVDPVIIQFHNYEFLTNDIEEIEFIENSHDFTGAKGFRKVIEKAAEQDPAQVRLVELINKHGHEKVAKMLERVEERQAEKEAEKEVEVKSKSKSKSKGAN